MPRCVMRCFVSEMGSLEATPRPRARFRRALYAVREGERWRSSRAAEQSSRVGCQSDARCALTERKRQAYFVQDSPTEQDRTPVLDCSGLFWAVLGCSGLFWTVLNTGCVAGEKCKYAPRSTGRLAALFTFPAETRRACSDRPCPPRCAPQPLSPHRTRWTHLIGQTTPVTARSAVPPCRTFHTPNRTPPYAPTGPIPRPSTPCNGVPSAPAPAPIPYKCPT